METWRQVIVEWVNCLKVIEVVIKELKELDDGTFYKKLLDLLSWTDNKSISGDDIVTKFIEVEYPDFKVDNDDGIRGMDQLYVASLVLLYASQKEILHKTMCNNLQHEAQVKIKKFLELSIPSGKNLTKEILEDAIKELADATFRTPKTPKTRGLKDFLNSPVVHSARSQRILSDQIREIRKLRAELEAEKYEKADLHEDIETYKNKVQNLQRKLQEKAAEMKALRDQQLMPGTPHCCKKDKNARKNFSQVEKTYRKEIDRLEEALMNKQKEMDTLEEDNEKLTNKLAGMERQCLFLRDKLEENEKTVENLQIQNDTKDQELLCLRMTNEELQAYLDEMSKTTASEQSFEVECGISGLHSPLSSLNHSEALSSVIELQLKEVREESASLKAQLDSMTEENKRILDLNGRLEKEASMLRTVQEKLDHALEKLSASNAELENLHQERESLLSQNEKLNADLQKLEAVEKELLLENRSNQELGVALKESKERLNETILTVQRLEQENNSYCKSIQSSYVALKRLIIQASKDVFTENNNVDEMTIMDFISNIGKMLNDSKSETNIKQTEILLLKDTLNEANLKVSCLMSRTAELEKTNETYEHNASVLKEELAQCNDTIVELKQSLQQFVEETGRLNKIEEEKNNLEERLEKLLGELGQKDSLLMDMKAEKENLIQDLFATQQKLNAQKQELEQLQECQRNSKESFNKLSNDYNLLQENFTKEEIRREEIEKKFARNDEKFKKILDTKSSLESQLLEKQRVIETTQSTLTKLRDDVHNLTQSLEEIKSTNKAQEQQHNIMTSEKTKELESLKFDNNNLKFELKNTKNKLTLLQQEISNLSDQITSKNEQIASLESDKNILQVEKEHLLRLQGEVESKTTVFLKELESQLMEKQRSYDQLSLQDKLKEETVELLRQKFENVTKEKIATELKMKEVIMNLQEVRSNQAAVLATQEKALKEKALHIEQLEKEFRESNNLLQKEIENEKILHCNLQSTCSELQIQSSKQMKTIQELEESLKKEKSEHDTTKKYLHNANTTNADILNACGRMKCLAGELKSTIKQVASDTSNFYSNAEHNVNVNVNVQDDDKVRNILSIVNTATEEIEASRKLLSHLHNTNETSNKTADLQVRVTELLEEKCDVQSKLEALRARTAQLDEHIKMQRDKIEEMKSSTVPLKEAEDLRCDLESLKLENTKIREEQDELRKRPTIEEVDKRIKEIHEKYESKIDDVKQRMKSAFNEQLAKLHKEQDTNLRDQLESLQGKMEQQCRKQAEELNRYRTHVSELSSQFWNVGEKLLTEQQQKKELEKELNELKTKYEELKLKLTQQAASSVEQKNIKPDRRDFPTGSENIDQVFQKISVVREKATYERRCSIQSLQKMGNAFNAEDEEGEVFDNIYLADMKNGQQSFSIDPDRVSILKMRNSLCKPHLKSSYPAEMQFNPLPFTEEEIKTGGVSEDVFNDSLSQSLLPEQKVRKKDRTQTSYKKPGPPTPSKNGGRLSLQGNELRSPNSKILRERNKDRATATPRTLKSLFSSRRQQDENVAGTPKGRRKSGIFSKSRNAPNR